MGLEDLVKKQAKAKKLSLAKLAEHSGVARTSLHAAFKREREVGYSNIDASTARRLAPVLGLSPADLLGAAVPDTLQMARAAADMLVEIDGAPRDVAWGIMYDLEVDQRSEMAFYAAARRAWDQVKAGRPSSPAAPLELTESAEARLCQQERKQDAASDKRRTAAKRRG